MQSPKSQARKSKFSPEEDAQLADLVAIHGDEDWITISCLMTGRNARQCRERWRHYLSPAVCLMPFSPEEDALLLHKYTEMGARWKSMGAYFPGRTDIMLKNRWLLLDRRQKRGDRAPVAPRVTTSERPSVVVPPPEHREPVPEHRAPVPEQCEPVPVEPARGHSALDIPWSDEGDAQPRYAGSSELTGDYFCLNFACFE
jgi:hypothetical protein